MFYQGFTLDTLLGSISVLLGLIALFVGGKAFRDYQKLNKSLNDKKQFGDNCEDNSQKAAGDIINNNCDVEALATITSSNFEVSLNHAYDLFEKQAKTNLQQIIEETTRIVKEQKPNLSGLTKLDWINIYFESAKNTSDEYMQKVWAKVLAKEMERPGSFGYKTLDVLKTMSADDFHIFEKMCSFAIENRLLQEDIYSKYGLQYMELVKMCEYGLITMSMSQTTHMVPANGSCHEVYANYLILVSNSTEDLIQVPIPVFLLTSVAEELMKVSNITFHSDFLNDYASVIRKQSDKVKVSIHQINSINGNVIDYQLKDLSSIQQDTSM